MVVITTQDSRQLHVDNLVGAKCGLIKNMLEDMDDADLVIPLTNIDMDVLERVVKYCEQNEIDENFLNQFMEMERELLFKVTVASNYLNQENLLEHCCKEIAGRIKDKSVEEIKAYLEIE